MCVDELIGSGGGTHLNRKYPTTPYWPFSPSVGRSDRVHPNPDRFVGIAVVLTEKLDGSNTLLHGGKIYGRSVSVPSEAKWTAMVKKHHAWKVIEPDVYLYGEDIFGVHSIAYAAVPEDRTFYAFALRDGKGVFAPFADVEAYAKQRGIPVVPVLFKGRFESVSELDAFMKHAHEKASRLGGQREGVVMRLASGFAESEFASSVCKSVRAGHVQSDEHWTRNWRPCKITRDCSVNGSG